MGGQLRARQCAHRHTGVLRGGPRGPARAHVIGPVARGRGRERGVGSEVAHGTLAGVGGYDAAARSSRAPGGDDGVPLDGKRHDEALIVVGVLADEVDAAGRGDGDRAVAAEAAAEERLRRRYQPAILEPRRQQRAQSSTRQRSSHWRGEMPRVRAAPPRAARAPRCRTTTASGLSDVC
jgi:hypothetical protein